MPYVLSEVVPESCQKLGPYATSTEAANVSCPAGTSFRSYAEEGEKTLKICCPMPAQLRPVPSVNAPADPTTPLDCPRGSYFIQATDGTNKCVYCFRVSGGEPCPGIPGVGRYKPAAPTTPTPVAPPVVTPPVTVVPPPVAVTPPAIVPLPATPPVTPLVPPTPTLPVPTPPQQVVTVKQATPQSFTDWAQSNWKWLAVLAAVGGAAYYFSKRKTALGDYCAEFFVPDQWRPETGTWKRFDCFDTRPEAEAHIKRRRGEGGGYQYRVAEAPAGVRVPFFQ